MASWTALGLPSTACAGAVTMMSAGSAARKREAKKGGEGGLMDWLSGALDKDHFSEMDPVLKKVEGGRGPPRPPVPPPAKKAASPAAKSSKQPSARGERGFGGLFGLFDKKER